MNVLTGIVKNGKLSLGSYTIGIQKAYQDHVTAYELSKIDVNDWYFYYAAYNWKEKKVRYHVW